jgi:predicted PurR-regulated permease PerM
MGNDYAILLAIGIALLDAFPVLGSGMVLVPWAVLSVIGGRYYDAAIVTTLFCVVTFLREILEPRLIGKEVGIKPLYLIISVYAGIELFGIGGVILGPVSLTILKAVREELIERERT